MTEKHSLKSQDVSGKKWVLFDGSCGLCHWSVRFIAPKDHSKNCCFVPLNSPFGIQLLKERGLYFPKDMNSEHLLNSVIFIDPNKGYYIKSEAVIKILKLLTSWHFLKKPVAWVWRFRSSSLTTWCSPAPAKQARLSWLLPPDGGLCSSSILAALGVPVSFL